MKTTIKTKSFPTIAALAICGSLLAGPGMRAATQTTAAVLDNDLPTAHPYESIRFSDSKEAGMMIEAYDILATGDHDYRGHRAKAMHEVEDAAKSLGVELKGGAHDHERQHLSDDKMREARDLLTKVLDNAEVKDQEHISKHLSEAIHQINVGLSVH